MPKYVQLRDDISLDMMMDFWRRTSCPNKLRHITMIQELKKGVTFLSTSSSVTEQTLRNGS